VRSQPQVCLIGSVGDPLLERLPAELELRAHTHRRVEATRLADLRTTLDGERLVVEGELVSAIVFRAPSNSTFSASYPAADHEFCDAETRAVWLAALHLESVACINRLDAIAWFESEHWTVWRRRLARRGVALANCEFGAARKEGARVWLPFSGCAPQPDPGETIARACGTARFMEQRFDSTLAVAGRIVDGPSNPAVEAAVRELSLAGVRLAEVVSDERGCVAWVDTQPCFPNARTAAQAAELVATELAGASR
jgi:hypothetical protein